MIGAHLEINRCRLQTFPDLQYWLTPERPDKMLGNNKIYHDVSDCNLFK